MKVATWIVVGTLGLIAAACSTPTPPQVATAGAASCNIQTDDQLLGAVYEPGAIYDVKPITRRSFFSHEEETVGAKLYVHAPPGVTKEYLERQLSCHAIAGEPKHPHDPFSPAQGKVTEVDVYSAGGGFAIHIIGEEDNGDEILARAKSIRASLSQTSQVSTAADERAAF